MMHNDDREEYKEYEKFWGTLAALLNPLCRLGVMEQFAQQAKRRAGIFVLRDRVTGFAHIIVVKYSERKWVIPPSLVELYTERTRRWVTRITPVDLLQRADTTYILVGKFSRGAWRKSYITRKMTGRTEALILISKRGRSIVEQAKRVIHTLLKFYSTRIRRIRETLQRLEEQGYSTTGLDITKLMTFITVVIRYLDEAMRKQEETQQGLGGRQRGRSLVTP